MVQWHWSLTHCASALPNSPHARSQRARPARALPRSDKPIPSQKRSQSMARQSRLCGFDLVRVQCMRSRRAASVLQIPSSIAAPGTTAWTNDQLWPRDTPRASHGTAGHAAPWSKYRHQFVFTMSGKRTQRCGPLNPRSRSLIGVSRGLYIRPVLGAPRTKGVRCKMNVRLESWRCAKAQCPML